MGVVPPAATDRMKQERAAHFFVGAALSAASDRPSRIQGRAGHPCLRVGAYQGIRQKNAPLGERRSTGGEFTRKRAVSFQPPASSGGKSATWRSLSPISGSPLGEESNGAKQCQDKALSWLLVAGSSF